MSTTESDLRAAYRDLADSAPTADSLTLPGLGGRARGPRRHRPRMRPAVAAGLVAAVLVTAVAVTVALTGTRAPAVRSVDVAPPGAAPYSTAYWFGANSLPGYTQLSGELRPTYQGATYRDGGGTGTDEVVLTGLVPDAAGVARLEQLPAVQVGATTGRYGSYFHLGGVPDIDPLRPAVFWPLGDGRWVVLDALGGRDREIALAATVRPLTDDTVAFARVGALPEGLAFAGADAYLHGETFSAPDGLNGSGYRSLSFDSRSLAGSTVLTIDTVYDPTVDLATATPSDLPDFTVVSGPWTRSTVAGHLAWVGRNCVLVQWGDAVVGVVSAPQQVYPTGSDAPMSAGQTVAATVPALGISDLVAIANSLTVAPDVTPGHGYPLAGSLPGDVW